MTMTRITIKLREYYEKAKVDKTIRKPLSWSLYMTWKYCEKYEEERKQDGK